MPWSLLEETPRDRSMGSGKRGKRSRIFYQETPCNSGFFVTVCRVSCSSMTSNSSLGLKCVDGSGARVRKLNRLKRTKTVFGVVRQCGLASVLDLTNHFLLILNVPRKHPIQRGKHNFFPNFEKRKNTNINGLVDLTRLFPFKICHSEADFICLSKTSEISLVMCFN